MSTDPDVDALFGATALRATETGTDAPGFADADTARIEAYLDGTCDGLRDLSDAALLRLAAAHMTTLADEADGAPPSPKAQLFRVARDFRDQFDVNILRVFERWNYIHPDGYALNVSFSELPEDRLRQFDPVSDADRAPGGPADVRPGDFVHVPPDGWLFVIAVKSRRVAVLCNFGLGVWPLAVIRNLLAGVYGDFDVRLIDGGRVIRTANGTDPEGGDA